MMPHATFLMMFCRPQPTDPRWSPEMQALNELAWRNYRRAVWRASLFEMTVFVVGIPAVIGVLWWLTP